MERILTENERKKQERDKAVCKRYEELMSVKGQSVRPVIDVIRNEFGIKSIPTVYNILNRMGVRG